MPNIIQACIAVSSVLSTFLNTLQPSCQRKGQKYLCSLCVVEPFLKDADPDTREYGWLTVLGTKEDWVGSTIPRFVAQQINQAYTKKVFSKPFCYLMRIPRNRYLERKLTVLRSIISTMPHDKERPRFAKEFVSWTLRPTQTWHESVQ